MTNLKREIFMSNGGYLKCDQISTTAANPNDGLDLTKDRLLMFHEKIGYFIASPAYGTWAQQKPEETFNDIRRMLLK